MNRLWSWRLITIVKVCLTIPHQFIFNCILPFLSIQRKDWRIKFIGEFLLTLLELCHSTYWLTTFISFEFIFKFIIRLLLHVVIHNLIFVHFLVNEALSVLAGKLVLWYVCKFLMHYHCLLSLNIENGGTLGYLSQAANNSSMNKSNRFINIWIVNSGDKGSFCFFN